MGSLSYCPNCKIDQKHNPCGQCDGPVVEHRPTYEIPKRVKETCPHPGEPIMVDLAACGIENVPVCKYCGREVPRNA